MVALCHRISVLARRFNEPSPELGQMSAQLRVFNAGFDPKGTVQNVHEIPVHHHAFRRHVWQQKSRCFKDIFEVKKSPQFELRAVDLISSPYIE
tara:strand:+ start:555 stop:836 length:282 start_codon:yes stop_codon:yes gene_type:complete